MTPVLSLERIELASRVIDPVFRNSPLTRHDELDLQSGSSVMVKVETLNPIRSFKGRGTDFYVRGLPKDTPSLVAASAGNFGQGLAYAARRTGMHLTVFAAETANEGKVGAMRRLGADVRLAGGDFDGAKAAARSYAEATGALFVEDSAHAAFAEGAGTIAQELTSAKCEVDAILVPVGNGALAAGIGTWMKYASPHTRVVGVVASGAPAMLLSFLQGRAVETAQVDTIADGIAIRMPVPFAVEAMRTTVDEVLAVSDSALRHAIRLLHNTIGVVVEPSGAAGLAAVLADPGRFRGLRVATLLCGANISPQQLRESLDYDLGDGHDRRSSPVSRLLVKSLV